MRRIGITYLVAATAVACGGSKSAAPVADQAPTAATTPAPSPKATPAPQPAQHAQPAATAVDFERLIALLPDAPAGWLKGKPKGSQIGMAGSISMAEARYDLGDSSISLEITDTAFDRTYLAPLSFTLAANYSERHTSGYSKAIPIGALPGYEKWDADARSAEVTALAGNRFVITAKGHNVENCDATRALVAAVDQSKFTLLK